MCLGVTVTLLVSERMAHFTASSNRSTRKVSLASFRALTAALRKRRPGLIASKCDLSHQILEPPDLTESKCDGPSLLDSSGGGVGTGLGDQVLPGNLSSVGLTGVLG